MPARPAGKLPLALGWVTGEDGWGGDMNRNLALTSVFISGTIESLTFNTPPAQAVEWDVFFVAENPTGTWTGQAGRLAVLFQDAWEFVTPYYGLEMRLRSTGSFVWWDGIQWIERETGDPAGGGGDTDGLPIGQKILYSRPGMPLAGERFVVPMDEPMVLPAGATGSLATCESAPEAAAFYRIYRNAQEIGTLNYAAGSFVGVFNVPASITLGQGDRLIFVAPQNVVTGFADVAFALRLLFTGN